MGNEFAEIFENWADTYDESIKSDEEYKEVFFRYDNILQEVAERAFGHVLEFGPGTGNLTVKLLNKGLNVTAIEPSQAMRKQALEKLGENAIIKNGDFLVFEITETPQTIVSTYAFHHLTDKEKREAIELYSNCLPIDGKIVFADTMFASDDKYLQTINDAIKKGYPNLAEDLKREYYTTIPILTEIFHDNGFTVKFEQFNDFVWIMEGVKKGEEDEK
ncbi:class I SAM-dependent methyltransferase [Niallia sp. NCCP-28]|uniref:class I SAM-dependent methyltransferase n=1 Tax=Niallia sp. NCCP-28 TaxID=2934712 RepID=UPI002087E50B|nr:class I SAM-dependent methyltransferase [Niallia sp. NCCP-28]GKU81364.1 putative methyltransferase [Niallia sp. NCCP-28]